VNYAQTASTLEEQRLFKNRSILPSEPTVTLDVLVFTFIVYIAYLMEANTTPYMPAHL